MLPALIVVLDCTALQRPTSGSSEFEQMTATHNACHMTGQLLVESPIPRPVFDLSDPHIRCDRSRPLVQCSPTESDGHSPWSYRGPVPRLQKILRHLSHLNFIGATVDLEDFGITTELLNLVLCHVAATSKHLHRFKGDLHS